MNARALAAGLALLAAAPPAFCQTGRMAPSAAPLPSPLEVIRRTFTGGDYLAPYLALVRSEAEYLASEPWSGLFLDFAALHASFVGDHATAMRYAGLREEAGEPDPAADDEAAAALAGAAAEDAVAAVLAAAGGQRAVFVNEAHHVAGHRALTAELLAPLY
ncbi:MAG TPA: hypothetical protein VFY65_09965, partial [Longimicrobium sp.]|nr:hypothetical protein [Longimicrobium sp.]